MIQTGQELKTFITGLNADAAISDDLLAVLVDNAKTVLEAERPWMVLRKTDTTKSVTTGSSWQTAIDLSTITDFSTFYGEYPVRLFDGSNAIEYYIQRPFDRRLEYKDDQRTFVYDANGRDMYLNGMVPFAGTLWVNYIVTTDEIDLDSSGAVWTLFPARFLPIIGYYAVGIFKGAVDYDEINRAMLPENQAILMALKNAMEKWDDTLQRSEIEHNDPTDLHSGWRSGAVNIHDP